MSCSLPVRVVREIADAEGVEPAELDFVLEDHVDTDLLERLPRRDDSTWTFRFELPGYEVTVTSGGLVLVDESDAADPTTGPCRSADSSGSQAVR